MSILNRPNDGLVSVLVALPVHTSFDLTLIFPAFPSGAFPTENVAVRSAS